MSRLRTRSCAAAMVFWALASLLQAEMATQRWGTPPAGPPSAKMKVAQAQAPTCYVVEARTAPKLDGKLDDEVWKTASTCHLARTLDGGSRAAEPTEVRLLRDPKTLYLAFRVTEPLLGKLQASRRSHDGGIWEDDSIEFFIGLRGAYYHFGVNALGSTYDARGKDAAWNSGLRAAADREPGAWTLEVAVPLASMAGEGPLPTEWTANFNRNRRTTGAFQESAWSPTYSGDSHMPSRFGKMLFRDPPAPGPGETPEQPVVKRDAVTILPAQGGQGVVRFDLSGLPKGTKVHRADLLIFRTTQVDGRMDEALTDTEIYPLFSEVAAGGKPEVVGAPLALRAPWFDRFDATEAVRQWASGKANGGFFVKACPFWNPEATCLDVAYEGAPKEPPAQVAGLAAFHRAGQTFITWKEIDDAVGADKVTWGELKGILDGLDQKRRIRYHVYRHKTRITSRNLPEAEVIAVVKPLSCWNVEGRNTDRPVDEFIATHDVLMTGHWDPFRDASIDGQYGRDCPVERFAIRDGEKPLARGTGLYVHTATKGEEAYYAVVTCVDGVQNTVELSEANALSQPVREAPAEPEPVLQGELPRMPFFNYDQKRLHYVRWLAPPLANVPCQAHNWSVGVPVGGVSVPREKADAGQGRPAYKRVPLELSLHRDGHSYWRTQYRIERDSIVLCPYDFPTQTWWYGYHEAYGTLRSFRQGCIQPYTERRLLSFVEWACRKWPVDRTRILVTGCRGGAAGSGALHLGIRHPGVFNLVIAGHPVIDYAEASRRTDRWGLAPALSMQAVWGKADWDLKTDDGKSFWPQHDINQIVQSLPAAADLPFMTLTSNHAYADCRKLYELLLTRHAGVMADFWWGGARYIPVSNSGTYPNVIRLDIRRDKSFLAFASAGGMTVVTEGKMGDFNRHFRWRDVVDEPGRYEATLFMEGRGDNVADVCPRRLQKFAVTKGKSYAWRNGDQVGEATVGDDGLLVLKGVKLASGGSRLAITPK